MTDRRRFLRWCGLGVACLLAPGRLRRPSGAGADRPPIDLAAPEVFETASFALG